MPNDIGFAQAAKIQALSKQLIEDTEARLARSYELLRKTGRSVERARPAAKVSEPGAGACRQPLRRVGS